ncbi:phage integrase family protein [Rhodopseudomonas thermotolerans]|uniref:Phage integrase family protein n=2 Tax=Rhodopseudomonas TaxID=1073 RepID=A0A336JXT8_9BRAD|nr:MULTISPECIES: tyrosine-type recombinase/integrase [Rhodopseudomonas]RED25781.1 phage integrase family protein [Rhodopseudomonas pentothenatexigens]REF90410.1 phage integrase family protein [Rhodopseudomonas thermotolerans]SSW93109.1 phage integrase family protein [Rhodopseudomonas pentothenatexigens]
MPDFLTRRNGFWHFVRRVPMEFAALDRRGIIRHSTRVPVSGDRTGRRAIRVATRLNAELEAYWHQLAGDRSDDAMRGYDEARRRARSLGFEYADGDQILTFPWEKRMERIEALLTRGLETDRGARTALLGTQPRPSFMLSKLFEEYETATKIETQNFSPNQMRVWRGGRMRVVRELVDLVGDKPVTELTQDDGLDYSEWWRERVITGETNAKSANKSISMLNRMLKEMSIRRRLNLPEIFKGLRLRGEVDNQRQPFETDFIQNKLLAEGALKGLNEEARHVIYLLADTGLRPSEAVNLQAHAIHLDAPIPYVEVLPDGRVMKTEDSRRQIPLVGTALAVMKLRPSGFPNYRDKSSSLSALVNKYLLAHGLRPSKLHSLYSLRHSFKDRLIAAEAPDSLIDSLMGHRTGKPKYGKGPPLELKLKFMESIAFKPPSRL